MSYPGYDKVTPCTKMNSDVKRYLSEIGSAGGKKSRRVITPQQQAEMQAGRKKAKGDLKKTYKDKKGVGHGRGHRNQTDTEGS